MVSFSAFRVRSTLDDVSSLAIALNLFFRKVWSSHAQFLYRRSLCRIAFRAFSERYVSPPFNAPERKCRNL